MRSVKCHARRRSRARGARCRAPARDRARAARRARARRRDARATPRPALERRAEVDALRRAHQLDRENVPHVAHDAPQLPRRAHRHRHDVFLVAVGRDRVDARRMRQHLALARERGGGDLRHHEAGVHAGVAREERRQPLVQVGMHEAVDAPLGDRREVRQRDREEVERHRHRLAVKVAAAQQLAVLEHERIVGRRIELAADDAGGEVDRVEHGPVHLRHAAQRVRVLHARIVRADATRGSRCRRAAREAARADAAWPSWPRASWMRASNATGVPSSASSDIAPATCAARQSRCASTTRERGDRRCAPACR